MRKLVLVALLYLLISPVLAEGGTIEGFWQDSARRILFDRSAPPGYSYGGWNQLDPAQTYPQAKQIRKSAVGFELLDLLYDDEEIIRVDKAGPRSIEFVRITKWTGCSMRHQCALQGEELLCSLENVCPVAGREVLDWRGEERYVRRTNCERDGKRQAQGIPVRCR